MEKKGLYYELVTAQKVDQEEDQKQSKYLKLQQTTFRIVIRKRRV